MWLQRWVKELLLLLLLLLPLPLASLQARWRLLVQGNAHRLPSVLELP